MAVDNRYIGMMQQAAYQDRLVQLGQMNAVGVLGYNNPTSEKIQAKHSDDSEKLLLLLEEV